MSLADKLAGRARKALGDLTDDPATRRQGAEQERKGEAKEELARLHEEANRKAVEISNLERRKR